MNRVTEILFKLKTEVENKGLKDLSGSLDRLNAEVKRIEKGFGRVQKSQKSFFESMKKTAEQSKKLFAFGGLFSGLTTGLSVSVAADFESEAIKMAVMVNPKDQETLENLKKQAMDLGAKTQFTATQALEVQKILGASGWDVERIKKSTPVVMNLTGAAGITDSHITLDSVASAFSDMMGGFGLKSATDENDDAKRFGDQIAYVMAGSNQTFSQLASEMTKLAPSFSNSHVPYEEALAISMVLADQGIRESEAGTALSSFLADLLDKPKRIKDVLDPKLSPKEQNEVFTKDGYIKSYLRLFELMANSKKFTPGDRMAIFGKDPGKYLLALMNQSIIEKAKGEKAILSERRPDKAEYEGKASALNQAMLKGFLGQMTLLKSALEGLMIKICNLGVLDFATDLVMLGQDFVDWVAKIDPKILKPLVMGFLAISGSLALVALGSLAAMASQFLGVSAFIGSLVSMLNPISLGIMAISAAIVGLTAYLKWDDIQKFLNKFENFRDLFYGVLEAIGRFCTKSYKYLANNMGSFFSDVGKNFFASDHHFDDVFLERQKKQENELKIIVEQKPQRSGDMAPVDLSLKTKHQILKLGSMGHSFLFEY